MEDVFGTFLGGPRVNVPWGLQINNDLNYYQEVKEIIYALNYFSNIEINRMVELTPEKR